MFSPYYAWAGRKEPLDHAALNVALYSPGRYRWTMTERRRHALHRTADTCAIGPSTLSWTGDGLTLDIVETAVPLPRPVRGRIRLDPICINPTQFLLDAKGRHVWRPIAPRARISVDMASPGLSWTGSAYLDTNAGSEPLETGFERWDWSRADLGDGAAVLYDGLLRNGSGFSLALAFDRHGVAERLETPPRVDLAPSSIWRVPRRTQADGGDARICRTLEDTPFYARSILATTLRGERTTAMHESLSLDRFANPIVKAMLPFRMPRRFM